MFLQETYELEDCWIYDILTASGHTSWTQEGSMSTSYSNNGLTVTGSGSGGKYYKLNETLPSTYSIEVDITGLTAYSALKGGTFTCENTFMQSTSSNILIATMNGAEQTVSQTYSSGDTIKIEYDGSDVKYYKNGTLLGTTSKGSGNYTGFSIRNVGSTGITIKNLKIKAL